MKCKICGGVSRSYAQAKVRQQYDTWIFRCDTCGFVFLDPVPWFKEAYSEPITGTDVGYVSRNLQARDFLLKLLAPDARATSCFCDYGAGYGLLVRLMRDAGFKFHWHDPHSPNLFARFCEASAADFGPYTAVTAVEVFEHLPDPAGSLQDILRFGKRVIFSTELLPVDRPHPNEWWYFGLNHGQHVSFYSSNSLSALARLFGLRYKRLQSTWHMMEPAGLPERRLKGSAGSIGTYLRRRSSRPRSLTASDFASSLQLEEGIANGPISSLPHLDLRKPGV
jgi:hypothetical protein